MNDRARALVEFQEFRCVELPRQTPRRPCAAEHFATHGATSEGADRRPPPSSPGTPISRLAPLTKLIFGGQSPDRRLLTAAGTAMDKSQEGQPSLKLTHYRVRVRLKLPEPIENWRLPFEYPHSKPLKIRYSCGNMSCAAITQARRQPSPEPAHRKSPCPALATARTSLSQS